MLIVPQKTYATVMTQHGIKDVKVLKLLEQNSRCVFDKKIKKEIIVTQEVIRFYEPESIES